MKAIKFLAVFCFVLMCGSPTFGQTAETPTAEVSKQSGKSSTDSSNDEPTKSVVKQIKAKDESEENYRIGFQDGLEIRVAKHEELSAPVRVSSDGTILLPRIDEPIVAVCKTEQELKEDIETLYKNYLKRPYVSVKVVEYRSQSVGVFGAVEKPGAFNLNRKVKLLEALAIAGGPDVEFAGSTIQIARVGNSTACVEKIDDPDNVQVQFLSYKLSDVQKGISNPWVRPGDIVSVLIADEAFVVGNVDKPTKILLREPVTLTQALAAAGGIGKEAKTSKIRIQRQEVNSSMRTELVYDLKEISARKIPDPVLQANDIVEVPTDGFKSARKGFFKLLGNGLPGLLYGL